MLVQIGLLLEPLRALTLLSIFVRFALAVLLGGIIGMERGKRAVRRGLEPILWSASARPR